MGGKLTTNVNDAIIKQEVNQHPLVIYTKPQCGYCKLAKELLRDEGVPHHEIDLDLRKAVNPDSYQKYVNGLVYVTRQTSVPQVFICGEFQGGYTELSQLREAKKLWQKVEQCMEKQERVVVG